MKRSRDELRVIVVFAGIAGLFFQLVGQTVFDATAGPSLTTAFVTIIGFAIGDAVWERYSAKRGPSDPPPPDARDENPRSQQSEQSSGRSTIDFSVAVA